MDSRKDIERQINALVEWRFDAGIDLAAGGLSAQQRKDTAARIQAYTAEIRRLTALLPVPGLIARNPKRRTITIITRRTLRQ